MNHELNEIEKYLREKYYFVDYPRNRDVIHYQKMVKEESQTLAERTTKLRDIEVDMYLDEISESEYLEKKAEVLDLTISEESELYSTLTPKIFSVNLDKHKIVFSLNNNIYTEHLSLMVREIQENLYRKFQEILQDIKTVNVSNKREYDLKVLDIKIEYRNDFNMYHPYKEVRDLNAYFTENDLLKPDQVLITPAIYFDIDNIDLISQAGGSTIMFIMEFYLDIIDKENSLLLNLKF